MKDTQSRKEHRVVLPDERITREKDFHNRTYESHSRKPLAVLYDRSSPVRKRYENLLLKYCIGKKILEYGCGLGSYGFFLASRGSTVTGIDISEYAILEARRQAQAENIMIDFRVMNAEFLELPDESFDVICGTGILHHLNLERALLEIRRVLTSNGKAVFIEPLGHNPVINIFRKLTPSLRSRDEHPLRMSDLETISTAFPHHTFEFYDLLALAWLPFHKIKTLHAVSEMLARVDHKLFAVIPFSRRFSWQVLILLEK